MEDQGKRLLLAVAIAFAIMMGWSFLFPPEQPDPDKDEDGEKPGTAEVEEEGQEAGPKPDGAGETAEKPDGADAGEGEGEEPPEAEQAEKPRGEATLVTFDFEHFRGVFTTHGGAIKSWTLKGERFEDRVHGGQIDLVPTGRDDFAPEVEQDLYSGLIGFEPVEGVTSHTIPSRTEWTIEKQSTNEIHFTWSSDDLQVWKKYTIVPDEWLVKLRIEVKKLSPGTAKQALRITTFGYQNPDDDTGGGWVQINRAWRTACYLGGSLNTNSPGYLRDKGDKVYRGKPGWFGTTHAYFLSALSLKEDTETQSRCIASAVQGAPKGTMRTDLVLGPPRSLEEGKFYARNFTAYYGPKYLGTLDGTNEVAGYQTGFDESIDLGWFGFIARPLLWLLLWFQGFVVNWGIAIVLLTVVVKLATLYWTTKSMRSMRSMAKLRPKVEEIQKKHKGDRQKTQVEIMNLYKAHGVNPLSGCLPMLLQMPIWIALYQTLRVAAELFQAPLIPGWIDDLTAPDPLYIMPVLLVGMMFIQARLTPTTADSTQQKIMQYGLPLVFGVMGFLFPAGLTLYILTNTTLTAGHHLWMRRGEKDDEPVGGGKGGGKGGAKKPAKASSDDDEGDGDDEDDGDQDQGGGKGGAKKPASGGQKKKKGAGGGGSGGSGKKKSGAGKKRGGQSKKKKRGSRS